MNELFELLKLWRKQEKKQAIDFIVLGGKWRTEKSERILNNIRIIVDRLIKEGGETNDDTQEIQSKDQ